MKSIYKIYIPVTSQEQSDRLKAICLKYKIPIWEDSMAFQLLRYGINNFAYDKQSKSFFILSEKVKGQTESTESEFIALLENNTEKL